MTCIESHKETVQTASRPHPLNDEGLQARPALESPSIPTFPSAWNGAEAIIKPAIVVTAAMVLLWTLLSGDFWRFHSLPDQTMFGRVTWGVAMAYGLIVFLSLIWRLRLWARYRPMESVDDADLPSVTVVIPAYNEGSLVRDSILSAAANRYPSDRMEIIVIDDGSSDDTWQYIRSASHEVGGHVNIRTFRQPRNMGKRQALYLGFQRARGDVFVTIDSDSVLEPDALRNAVTPLVRDPDVDCVAGCVQVMNPKQNLFTRFLKVYFSLSFKFVRAYQNEFRGVFCTPGALSVYRADVVRRVADEWLGQHFLGLPCATGEDRSMTNLILREGGLTAYQGNAVVWSKAPDQYRDMVNMFLRWARSNIRETIVLWRFMFTRFRSRFVNTFRLNMVIVLLSLVMPPLLIAHSAALLATSDGFFVRYLGVTLIFASIMSVIYYRNERDHDWIWLLVYNFFWITSLSWIIPYAALTLRNTRWLTRGADDQDPDVRPNSPDPELAELMAN